MTVDKLKDYLSFCERLAISAGEILIKEKSTFKVTSQKDRQDIATSADLTSEKFIVSSIVKSYPSHNIYSEEIGKMDKSSDFEWVIDPLDGTKEFVRDVPLFNCSIALTYKKEPIVSAIFRPIQNELYSAAKNIGSFFNGKKTSVSNVSNLKDSFVYCYLPSYYRHPGGYDKAWKKLGRLGKKVYRLRSLADENTAICWLAKGGCEAYLNISNPPSIYDVLPGILIAKNAGAVVFGAQGEELTTDMFGAILIANNADIRDAIIDIVSG